LLEIDKRLTGGVLARLTANAAIDSRNSILGTSLKSVTAQITQLDEKIRGFSTWVQSEQKRFSGMMSA
jgi:hypothetical protein